MNMTATRTDTAEAAYIADLRRVINGWRIDQDRRKKRAERAAVAPTYSDSVTDDMVRCAWVLCHAYAGAANVPRVRISDRFVEVTHYGDLATTDGRLLTQLVIAAHEAAVRVSVSSSGPAHVRLMLHPRSRTKSVATNHQTLDTALADARARWVPCPVKIPGGDDA